MGQDQSGKGLTKSQHGWRERHPANEFCTCEGMLMNSLILADAAGTASGVFLGLGTFGLAVAFVLSLFWLWMLIDALTNASLDVVMRVVWAAVIFFLPFLGALVYFFIWRKARPGSAAM